MSGLGGHAPPARRFSRVRRLARRTGKADYTDLIRRFAIPSQRRQTQQTYAFFTRAQTNAAKGQDVPIKALRADIAEIGHARKLAFKPMPAARLADKPRPMKQPAGQPVTDPRLEA